MQPMDALVARAQGKTRFSLMLIAVFALCAALLAAIGLFGVLSTIVRQRRGEIGVRMAIGARPGRIVAMVIGHGFRLSAIGLAVGLVAAFVLTRAMSTMLVGVEPTDPATFAATALLFLAVAGAATWIPARRAAGLDPVAALRED